MWTTVGSKLKFMSFILVIHWFILVCAKHFQWSIQTPRVVTLNFTLIQFVGFHLSLNSPRSHFFEFITFFEIVCAFSKTTQVIYPTWSWFSTGQCDLATAAFTLPLENLDAPSLEVFKTRLDEDWNSLGQWKRSLAMAGIEMRYL